MKKILKIVCTVVIIIIIFLFITKLGQQGSTASQNQKKLESELVNIKVNSKMAYNNSSNTYELVCDSDNLKNLKWEIKCFNDIKSFVITAKFDEPINNYTHYCVDSTGKQKTITSLQNDLIISADTLCPQE